MCTTLLISIESKWTATGNITTSTVFNVVSNFIYSDYITSTGESAAYVTHARSTLETNPAAVELPLEIAVDAEPYRAVEVIQADDAAASDNDGA
eukprot:4835185-Amphidinium_carterae.1